MGLRYGSSYQSEAAYLKPIIFVCYRSVLW